MRTFGTLPATEEDLAALATELAGCRPAGRPERAGRRQTPLPFPGLKEDFARAIVGGGDPLGDAFCRLRPPKARRRRGAVYTPRPIVESMLRWAADRGQPARVIDPGAGSGRFVLAAGRIFPAAKLVAVETDPLAALTLRANAAVLGMADRLTLLSADYRTVALPRVDGPTLYVGNPPYVRHHDIAPGWKDWLATSAAQYGLKASRLAGLHVHFVLKTCQLARPGDFGAFITAAEWLDVNYGDVMRKAFVDVLGGSALHVVNPAAAPFPDADTTGAIACFRTGRRTGAVRVRAVDAVSQLGGLDGGRPVARSRLAAARRWSPLLRPAERAPRGYVELGELCRVHRGQVTGCNAVWIAGRYPGPLPDAVLVATVTRARELFDAAPRLSSTDALRRVVDLPVNLDAMDDGVQEQVGRFLGWARSMRADASYVAGNRRAWWAVGLREPAPILCTYMARRPPAFVRNPRGARHLNIAHGLYPREPLADATLDALSAWLQRNVRTSGGRTYAGGLTKFEPREIERILVPPPERLHERAPTLDRVGTGA